MSFRIHGEMTSKQKSKQKTLDADKTFKRFLLLLHERYQRFLLLLHERYQRGHSLFLD